MEKQNFLSVIGQEQIIERANRKIERFKNEKYPGLYSRWNVINKVMGGCFRFGEVTIICGASGSGKSFVLNMLRQDFLSDINKYYNKKFKILSFSFEMAPEDEMIRTYATRLKTSYSKLLSSDEKISEDYFKHVLRTSESLRDNRMFFVETSGNYMQIYNTVKKVYEDDPCNLIITLDHTLLTEYLDENSEVELVSNMARLSIRLKKEFGAMVIFLSQLNDKIEQVERIKEPMLHYPQKTDIHGSKAIYMAADSLFVLHRPERLGIVHYGRKNWETKDLVVWHLLKSRLHGNESIIKMKQDFEHGNLIFPYDNIVKEQGELEFE